MSSSGGAPKDAANHSPSNGGERRFHCVRAQPICCLKRLRLARNVWQGDARIHEQANESVAHCALGSSVAFLSPRTDASRVSAVHAGATRKTLTCKRRTPNCQNWCHSDYSNPKISRRGFRRGRVDTRSHGPKRALKLNFLAFPALPMRGRVRDCLFRRRQRAATRAGAYEARAFKRV